MPSTRPHPGRKPDLERKSKGSVTVYFPPRLLPRLQEAVNETGAVSTSAYILSVVERDFKRLDSRGDYENDAAE